MIDVRVRLEWVWWWSVVVVVMVVTLAVRYLPQAPTTPVPITATTTTRHCQVMFNIQQDHRATMNSDALYLELSRKVAPLVEKAEESASASGSQHVFQGTRLQLTSGSVPYIPCKVEEYDAGAVGQCMVARAASQLSTWLAFYGDSTMRQKMEVFIKFLPPELLYTYYLNNKKVSRKEFLYRVAHHFEYRPELYEIIGHRPLDVLSTTETDINFGDNMTNCFNGYIRGNNPGRYQDTNKCKSDTKYRRHYAVRVTLVWASRGSRSGVPMVKGQLISKLQEWAGAEVVPDVVVVGFGKWFLVGRELYASELQPFTQLHSLTLPLVGAISRLTQRTHVLLWSQSRYRWHNLKISSSQVQQNKTEWKKTLYLSQFSDSIPLIDTWLWAILGSTGVWRWDSTLPFHLANQRECDLLRDSGLHLHHYYTGKWWFCSDPHHSSYETNTNEIQMLLNLLCNPYLSTTKHHCCTSN